MKYNEIQLFICKDIFIFSFLFNYQFLKQNLLRKTKKKVFIYIPVILFPIIVSMDRACQKQCVCMSYRVHT